MFWHRGGHGCTFYHGDFYGRGTASQFNTWKKVKENHQGLGLPPMGKGPRTMKAPHSQEMLSEMRVLLLGALVLGGGGTVSRTINSGLSWARSRTEGEGPLARRLGERGEDSTGWGGVGAEIRRRAASLDGGAQSAVSLVGEALTQEALLINNDGVILRCLGQTEELAPVWTDRQTDTGCHISSALAPVGHCGDPADESVYPEL